jgi:hypothetical protein
MHLPLRIGFIVFLLGFQGVPLPVWAQEPLHPPQLSFWVVGGGGSVSQRFGPEFWETLREDRAGVYRTLVSVAEGPRTAEEISAETGLSLDRVHEITGRLGGLWVLERGPEMRWATTLPVITDREMGRIRDGLRGIAGEVASSMGEEVSALKVAYEENKASDEPGWERMAHLILDRFLVDGAFLRALLRMEEERGLHDPFYSEAQEIIPAFFLERGENFSTFGTNSFEYERGGEIREVYVLHGGVLGRYTIRVNQYEDDPRFSEALFGLSPGGGTQGLGQDGRDVLTALEWMDEGQVLVPVVRAESLSSLTPDLDEVAERAAEVVFLHHSEILDLFEKGEYSTFLTDPGDYIQVCYHVLFGLLVESFVSEGLVPEIPEVLPEHFGAYIVFGRTG